MTAIGAIVGGVGRQVGRKQAWLGAGLVALILVVIFGARGLRHLSGVQSFLHTYSGSSKLSTDAPVGFPIWLNVQHAVNALFMLFVIRSGWQIRATPRPKMFWTRTLGPSRTKPGKISMEIWLHITTDTLWVLNGVLFYVLIFSTGQWRRIIPTHWDIFPNAVSTALQYASLHWPEEHGWTNYNALQVLSYFAVVFLAAPLSLITGLRVSPSWPKSTEKLNRLYPIELARKIHYPTMLFFAAFIVAHIVLVLATGAKSNLNHMYAARHDGSWLGVLILVATVIVMVAAWLAARPVVLRSIASLTGKVSR